MSQSDAESFERHSQSQFVAQEGDEEILWEVVEITGEKPKYYKVRWAGIDPDTGKPWVQSWVLKADCTDDLVHEWKRKKTLKKKSAKGRLSTVSRASRGGTSRVSEASSSTATKRSTRAADSTATPPSRARDNRKRTRSTVSSGKLSTPITKKKRRSSESAVDSSSSSSDEAELVISAPRLETSLPPHSPTGSLPALEYPQEFGHASPILKPVSRHVQPHDNEDHIVQEMYDEYMNFDVPSQPKNAVRPSTHSNGIKDDSYRQGVVPETETESQSQSQSQPLQQAQAPIQQRQPSLPPPQQPISSQEDKPAESSPEVHERTGPATPKLSHAPTILLPPCTTPARSSLISKMKPRTPGSSSRILFDDNTDIFHPPRLEVHLEEDEEQEELDMVEPKEQKEPSRANGSKTSRTGSGPLRPLPRLSPSEFVPHLPSVASTSSLSGRSVQSAADEKSDEAEVEELMSSIEQFSSAEKGGRRRKAAQEKTRSKGKGKEKEIVGDARSAEEEFVTDGEDSGEEDLENVVYLRGQHLAARARAEEVKRKREFDGEPAERKRRNLTDLLSEGAVRKGREKHELELNEGTDKGKVRRTGHAQGPWWEKEKKPKKRSREQSEPQGHQPTMEVDTLEEHALYLREEDEESTQDLMMEAAEMRPIEDVEMDQAWDVEPQVETTEEVPELGTPPQSRLDFYEPSIRSRSKSSTNSGRSAQRMPSKEHLVLPSTAPIPSPPAIESQEPDHNPDFVATLALLNEKSQENFQLANELSTIREELAAAQAPRLRELQLERELQLTQETLGAAQKSLAESERLAAELTRLKDSAEKEREFFREHYGQASGFVTTVREENAELEKQAQIARDQATAGVEVVKATYVARVKALEDDVRTYKRLAMFIMEKDVRTNDDIRRRAAEEPELRARCEELAEENRDLKTQITDLRDDLDDKEAEVKEVEYQLGSWKKQTAVLNADLTKVKSRQEGVDKVYQCGWRVDDDVNAPCEQEFTTYEEFEAHMFSDQHLDAKLVHE
ncbi:hypothetical protein C0991_008037 [Blastosporella zonata]|nr:hypothetical protein C0991_008037 [Blastosporella zonata]